MLTVGIPKEIKPLEKRVGLTPSAVFVLTSKKIRVLIERGAGSGSGFSDEEYQKKGAVILPDAESVYLQSDLIQKVKEPLEPEYRLIKKKHLLFCYLHLASPENCALVETLVRSGCTAFAYETVEVDGRFPLLAPMSEIAGALAAAYASELKAEGLRPLELPDPDKVFKVLERTAAQYPDFKNVHNIGKTVIFGGGVAGFKALEIALKLKGETIVIEKNPDRQEFLKRFTRVLSPDEPLKGVLESADVLIGSVHSRGARAAQVFEEKMLKDISKKRNKVIVDIAIDQGGNFPQSGPTSYKDAVYFDSYGNLRFGVANMPSLCGRGASDALSQATLPYTLLMVQSIDNAFQVKPELSAAINIKSGQILVEAIRLAHHRI